MPKIFTFLIGDVRMKISDIKNFVKVGTFVENREKNIKKTLNCEWCINKELQKDGRSRIYIFTVNNEIAKIGGSVCKGGIKNTIRFYESIRGRPGPNRFALNHLILEELRKGNRVDIYMTILPDIEMTIPTLFDKRTKKVNLSYKEVESKCLSQYKEKMGRFPKWNFQESRTSWPSCIEKSFVENRGKSK